ncbi:MAG: radical SAM protein [Deltaproteobacteria bacterium]|nr:radical SAM protein [Deltaproteobacteria bacterium]
MRTDYTDTLTLTDLTLWKRLAQKRIPLAFDLELTARCNNDCRHCSVNLPADDAQAQQRELDFDEISALVDQAVSLGSLWCLLTGGEPLVRPDFPELYLCLRRKGLLVTVFTNACLVTEAHAKLLRDYPPRDVEVTVYGANQQTYERVTRRPGSYAAFRRGLALLEQAGVRVRLKAMALAANLHDLPAIARFCREHTRDYFHFDPQLNLRCDHDSRRNRDIRAERLSPEQIVAVEQADAAQAHALKKACEKLKTPAADRDNRLFRCGAGRNSFNIGYDGMFRLCGALNAASCRYDLRAGSLADAWLHFAPRILDMQSQAPDFLAKCRACPLADLCFWCPAHAELETGKLDGWCEYFCRVAHARFEAAQKKIP